MKRAFRQGIVAGILAPLFVLAAAVYWIYRSTQRVPFPVYRDQHDELTIRLVEPHEVNAYWQPWRADLEPLIARVQMTVQRLKAYGQED